MPRSRHSEDFTTEEKGNKYEALNPLLRAMHQEFQELSKKKPDAAVSKAKIKIVNRLLGDILKVLDTEPSIGYLDTLDEDALPQNSDMTLVLSQYCAAMDAFHEKYHGFNQVKGEYAWFTK